MGAERTEDTAGLDTAVVDLPTCTRGIAGHVLAHGAEDDDDRERTSRHRCSAKLWPTGEALGLPQCVRKQVSVSAEATEDDVVPA